MNIQNVYMKDLYMSVTNVIIHVSGDRTSNITKKTYMKVSSIFATSVIIKQVDRKSSKIIKGQNTKELDIPVPNVTTNQKNNIC